MHTIYRELSGAEITKEPQPVVEGDLEHLETLRTSGGPNTKEILEDFGRDKLGIEVNKTFKVNRILDEALIPLVKEKLSGIKASAEDPIVAVVTEENMKEDSDTIAENVRSSEIPSPLEKVMDFASADESPIKIAQGYVPPTHLKHVGTSEVKATGNIFLWTKDLSALNTLRGCTKEGVLI